jgi:hypothetical protein
MNQFSLLCSILRSNCVKIEFFDYLTAKKTGKSDMN